MKIIICCSISAADEVLAIAAQLKNMGHTVEIPDGVISVYERGRTQESTSEKAKDKIHGNLIKKYYEKITKHDVVLIVNPEKRGVKGYIGGNTLMEMGFAHVLDKKIYVLYPLPEMQYSSEIEAMQPTVLNGDISQLQ